ncbi:glycoside hydrolase superfamily [Neohortaea acidophila]|uniref:Glycoside hydrolase superfamily n=1 Tax=Neohortaea acidophila TaxID=245834 RepID=A0A6A6PLT4_9PEZI|nr:glycoside hydrolase superfamily [Neohortaea acidophila]KAF2481040.1 glycoside hydrolase superfamily [Neohortaea acidophila]
MTPWLQAAGWSAALLPLSYAAANPLARRQTSSTTATVNLADQIGTPEHLAAGFLYGIPDTANQVPSYFYTQMGFQGTRAGGSQLPAPARGWVYGENEFQNRFDSALSNYKTARQYDGTFQILVADLWGADGTNHSIPMPGDNGDFSSYDAFLTALIDNINSNDMLPGLIYDLWNEPDGGNFWTASEDQFLQTWGRTHARIKGAFPDLDIIGPSSASQPSSSNTWLTNFYNFVKPNGSIPDIYSWHEETNGDQVDRDVAAQHALESSMGLPNNPININEYGTLQEQQPAATAWYISQLERVGVRGLRGNWASSYSLHDYFAGLLGKPGANTDEDLQEGEATGYWPNSEWLVYQYYNLNMTGERLSTTASGDGSWDVYATYDKSSGRVKMLCGARLTSGTFYITVENLSSLGLPTSGTIDILTYHFDWSNNQFEDNPSPDNQGYYGHSYSGNSLTFYIGATETLAYAFEFSV